MKKFYNQLFYISENGNICEKVMLARVITTVIIVVACLIAMSFTAYAYFSYHIVSDFNIIKAANFEVNISISEYNSLTRDTDITTETSNYKSHKVQLEGGKIYNITVTPTVKNSAKTGFIIIEANGCTQKYHTQQLGIDENQEGGKTDALSFKLTLTDDSLVFFRAHWGTSSYYAEYMEKGKDGELYITQNKEIKMIINGITEHKENVMPMPTPIAEAITPSPEINNTPLQTATPEVIITPEATITPKVTITPEATITPKVTITPEATITPEVTESTEENLPEETNNETENEQY